MLNVLNKTPSIINHYLRQLRDVNLQTDQTKFEQTLELLGTIAGYELSKQLAYQDHDTQTPLGVANTPILQDQLVLTTILRAGLPVHRGVHTVLQKAELAFIGAGRKPETGGEVEISLSYIAAPNLTGKILIIADTMLATGKSIIVAYNEIIKQHGQPKKVYIVAIIASQTGVDYVQTNLPEADLIICAVDPELNDKFYIVPGLGDAGDLLYGAKL